MKIAVSDEVKQKKQIIKLRKLFSEIHNECNKYGIRNALMVENISGKPKCNRSYSKILYFLKRGDWSETFQKKVNALQKKAAQLGYTGRKKPRDFWLPTIIEHATKIQFVIYQAKSVRKLSISQARSFAKKHEYEKLDYTQSYFAEYYNGRDCNIRVEYENLIEYYQFTDIVICLCDNNEIPKIQKRNDHTLDLLPFNPVLFITHINSN